MPRTPVGSTAINVNLYKAPYNIGKNLGLICLLCVPSFLACLSHLICQCTGDNSEDGYRPPPTDVAVDEETEGLEIHNLESGGVEVFWRAQDCPGRVEQSPRSRPGFVIFQLIGQYHKYCNCDCYITETAWGHTLGHCHFGSTVF